MAYLQDLLKNGLYTELKNDDTFWVSVGGTAGGSGNGRLFYVKAPAGTDKPYARYSFGIVANSAAFNSDTPVVADFSVYIDVFSSDAVSSEAEDIAGYAHDVMDSLTLSISGYSDLSFRRANEVTQYEDETNIWHTMTEYRSSAHPS